MSRSAKKRGTLLAAALGTGATLALIASLGVFAGAVTAATTTATTTTTAPPVNSSTPTISGIPANGQTLTASNGSWSGTNPITYSDVWLRCDPNGGSCSSISGATSTTYLLKQPDEGNTLRVRVTATNADGATASTSVPTAAIRPPAPTTTTTATTTNTPPSTGCTSSGGTIPVANISSPARLTIDQTQVSPSTLTYGSRSLTARFHVSACGGSVEGALVYVTAVPYGQFATPNEQATGSDGWATLQFTALAGYPVSQKQQLLVLFVRARKQGDSILGGISTRRLVSFRVTRG